jgi:hypothetical protein
MALSYKCNVLLEINVQYDDHIRQIYLPIPDVSANYVRNIFTIDIFSKVASIHPSRHACTTKKVIEHMNAGVMEEQLATCKNSDKTRTGRNQVLGKREEGGWRIKGRRKGRGAQHV